jgi:hypothetical protein
MAVPVDGPAVGLFPENLPAAVCSPGGQNGGHVPRADHGDNGQHARERSEPAKNPPLPVGGSPHERTAPAEQDGQRAFGQRACGHGGVKKNREDSGRPALQGFEGSHKSEQDKSGKDEVHLAEPGDPCELGRGRQDRCGDPGAAGSQTPAAPEKDQEHGGRCGQGGREPGSQRRDVAEGKARNAGQPEVHHGLLGVDLVIEMRNDPVGPVDHFPGHLGVAGLVGRPKVPFAEAIEEQGSAQKQKRGG